MRLLLSSTLALTIPAILLAGQDAPRFATRIDLVGIHATVTDRNGRYVPGLTRDDFVVSEDGQPVDIAHFSAEREPVSLGILLDVSASMEGPRLNIAKIAIGRLLTDLLRPGDEVFFHAFAKNIVSLSDWTTARADIVATAWSIRVVAGTSLNDAILHAVPLLRRATHRKRALLVLSDGEDTTSKADASAVIRATQATETIVYAISLGAPVARRRSGLLTGRSDGRTADAAREAPEDLNNRPWSRLRAPDPPDVRNVLGEITRDSGGRAEVVDATTQLEVATASIADELSRQYIIGIAAPSARDGKWHPIEVTTKDPSFRVRARRGYAATP